MISFFAALCDALSATPIALESKLHVLCQQLWLKSNESCQSLFDKKC